MKTGTIKVKLFFLWLILLLSFISNISFSASNESVISDLDVKSKPILQNGYFTTLFDEIDGNKKVIAKNLLNINKNSLAIDTVNNQLSATEKTIELNQAEILKNTEISQQNKININKDKIDISNRYASDIEKLNIRINQINQTSGLTNDYLDRFWVLIAAALVFFMQAGYKTFEAGMVRKGHDDNVAIKNMVDWLVISLVYFSVGFGLMFGDSLNGFIGTNLFSPTMNSMQSVKDKIDGQYLGLEFFLYQLAFAAIAVTIVSGAMSERIALIPYIVLSVFVGTIIYPVFGHWVWGGTYFQNNQGWLYAIGFRDFAGSTVVHSIGAWVALAGIIVIGPRIGRYDTDGNINKKDFIPSNLGYSTLGILILWFGWWGFNGGSQFKYDENVATIIVNTTLSGSAAGLTAFFHALIRSRDKDEIFPKLLGGILGGLVAITASCNRVSSWDACIIGVIAGLVYNYSHDFLMLKLRLDDPVGAIAVHGFCGVWGTLCVAFFGQLDSDFFSQNRGILFSEHSMFGFLEYSNVRVKQAIIQLIGIFSAFLFAFSLSYIFFKLIRRIPGIGLRVLPSDEKNGSILGIAN